MRTPQLRPVVLDALFDQLLRTGGEVAVGILDDASNLSLVRVRIEEPPVAPRPPEEATNLWFRAEDRRAYRVDSLAHVEAHRTWLKEARDGLARFKLALDSLLARDPYANRTDVWGAISRAAYFLDEPGHWRCEPRQVALLISDAVDNVGAPSVPWPPVAELYLVNGTPSLGALEALDPVRFESIEAALRYVLGTDAR